MTKEEWWELLLANSQDLLKTVRMSANDSPQPYRLVDETVGGFKEKMWKICAEFEDPKERDIVVLIGEFIHGIDTRNHEMVLDVLNTVWAKAPDHASIHKRPAWSVLCELCSEDWIFYEESANV